MHRIGHYLVEREGGGWAVTYMGEIVSSHRAFWNAIKAAREYDWRNRHEKKPPASPSEAGGKEPKTSGERVI